jgi:outer membrane protein assembly factor BamA
VLVFAFQKANAQVDSSNYRAHQKNVVLRTMDWGYRIIEGDTMHPRKVIIAPIPILAYKPETRWIYGVSLTAIFRAHSDSITRPSFVRANISYSQEHQFAFIPDIEYFSKGNKVNIRGKYTYTDFGENYYGIGAETPASNKERYTFVMQKARVKIAYLIVPKVYIGVQYNYEKMYSVLSDSLGLLKTTQPLGHDGYEASGAGFTIYYDNRDHVYYPYNGHFVELSNVFYQKTFGSQYAFVNITLDARKYVQLWKENVLAFQGYANLNDGDIPFRMQGVLGSDMFMRGYYNGRFRDKHSMAFQAELRKNIWGPLGAIFFVGGGTVANNKTDLFSNIKPNIGFGLRFKAIPKERVNISVDYGIGNNGNRALYIGMHEAF